MGSTTITSIFFLGFIGLISCDNVNINVKQDMVQYRLFENMDPVNYQTLTPPDFRHKYNKTSKYVLLFHDSDAGFDNLWYHRATNAFMNLENFVVIAIQYTSLINSTSNEDKVGVFTSPLGATIAELLISLKTNDIELDSQVELVGHGLGAHVAGAAADNARPKTNQEIKRFFALDPSNSESVARRMQNTDSKRTIVFHTSVKGIQTCLGHLDFYPDGGSDQRDCQQNLGLGDRGIAAYYFYCSIHEDCRNWATRCDSFAEFSNRTCQRNDKAKLGYKVDDDAQNGTYFGRVNCRERQKLVSDKKNLNDIRKLEYLPNRPNMYDTKL